MSWGQSDTLSYESIMNYYKSKTNMIEFYQLSENQDKVTEIILERDRFIENLGDNLGKGQFYEQRTRECISLGDYQDALEYGIRAAEICKNILGSENMEYAGLLNNLALIYSDIGDFDQAIHKGTEVVRIIRKAAGMMHPNYASAIDNLATYNLYLGNYSEALELATKAMKIRKEVLGVEHLDYFKSLLNLALCNSKLGNYTEAIKLGTIAIESMKGSGVEESHEYASALDNLAGFYSDSGNYSTAIRLEEEALEVKIRVLGSEHPSSARSLLNLANFHFHIGHCSKAIQLGTEAVKVMKNSLGENHPDYATTLNNLSGFYYGQGIFSEAIRLGTEAAEIKKMVLGTDHPDYAESIGNLAIYHEQIGDVAEGLRLNLEALESLKKSVGTEHPLYANALSHVAVSFSLLGNNLEVLNSLKEALEIKKKTLGTDHPSYLESLGNLAVAHFCQGNVEEAIRLSTEIMEKEKIVYGVEHPRYAKTISVLALYYSTIGNYSEALQLGTEAVEILRHNWGTEHPDYATSLSCLALYNDDIGNFQEAIRLGRMVVDIRERVYGKAHPNYLEAINDLSISYYNDGKYSNSYNMLSKSLEISRDNILVGFSELSPKLQESLWADKYSRYYNINLPSAVYRYQTKESVSELYDKTALFAKGILLNSSVGMRKLILESGDSVLVAKYDALAANKSIYDKQLEKPIKERFIDMDSLRSVIQRQEMELARDSKAYGDFARNLRIKWQDVQQRLGKNDLAIEFLDFPVYGTDSIMYVALTLKKGYDNPHMITLFEKRQLKSISEDNYYTNTDLYNLIWKPLEEELSGVENVYFSPSGDLHRIGIEYVPVTMTENICDKYNLHRLSSTRQLAYIQDETKGDKSVLYGGLKYDAAVSDTILASPSTRENRGFTFVPRAIVDSLDIRGSYKYLPGTKEEADHIVSYLNTHSIPYKYYYGAAGTEESFKGLDGSKPKTLHIATHGFYMTEQDAERKNFARPLLQEETRVYHEDKPMTRSGLLLSGCSRALNHENIPDGIEDGILTADEISKLDLRGLDLVVLSACQTGLGDITSGEGVFGLQRGFKNAGAKTIIMSLWKVSDIATQHLMTSFYNHYLSGMPKEQSFRMAQKELREMIGPGQNKPDWAAFVMLDGI